MSMLAGFCHDLAEKDELKKTRFSVRHKIEQPQVSKTVQLHSCVLLLVISAHFNFESKEYLQIDAPQYTKWNTEMSINEICSALLPK